LLLSKSVAAYLTRSLAVLTSVMDSFVDLISGALLWWSGRAIRRGDPYKYPGGRSRLEPFSIVILSVIMSICSLAMVRESIETIVDRYYESTIETQNLTVIKLILFAVCRASPSPVARTLAQDHRNDVVSNSGALGFGLLAAYVWKYFDATGALVICAYIFGTWFVTGYEQMLLLTGYTANPDLIKKFLFVAVNHDKSIQGIKTIRAFHFGNEFLVEVEIILPDKMTIDEAHVISVTLQKKLENLDEVERAFVQIDYESNSNQ
ncbi:hypothetical protein HELRODRAFT_63877, partial [Helobdella robusta]